MHGWCLQEAEEGAAFSGGTQLWSLAVGLVATLISGVYVSRVVKVWKGGREQFQHLQYSGHLSLIRHVISLSFMYPTRLDCMRSTLVFIEN